MERKRFAELGFKSDLNRFSADHVEELIIAGIKFEELREKKRKK